MGEILAFPLPKDPRERAKLFMKLAKQEQRDSARRADLFNQATEAFNQSETNSSAGGQ